MNVYPFFFSNQFTPRLLRHLCFWFIYYIYSLAISLPIINVTILSDMEFYKSASREALFYLPLYLFSVYFSLYVILPGFLLRRKFLFLVLTIIPMLWLSVKVSYLITAHYFVDPGQIDPQMLQTISQIKGTGELIIITGFALSIKIIKDYYLREEEYQKLSTQHIYQQLDIMKMKIEPAILLGVLKNIRTDIDKGGLHAPGMILKLSDLLSYILYETEEPMVPLKKEIGMLLDYSGLKGLIYGDRLKAMVQIRGDIGNQMIPPLLLLPFLEISFPQEDEKKEAVYISEVNIQLSGNHFSLSAKTNLPHTGYENKNAVAIFEHARQNLRIKYPNKHTVEMINSDGEFKIQLELTLTA